MWNVFAVIGIIATAFVLFVVGAAVALIVYFACEDRRLARSEQRAAVREAQRILRSSAKRQNTKTEGGEQ